MIIDKNTDKFIEKFNQIKKRLEELPFSKDPVFLLGYQQGYTEGTLDNISSLIPPLIEKKEENPFKTTTPADVLDKIKQKQIQDKIDKNRTQIKDEKGIRSLSKLEKEEKQNAKYNRNTNFVNLEPFVFEYVNTHSRFKLKDLRTAAEEEIVDFEKADEKIQRYHIKKTLNLLINQGKIIGKGEGAGRYFEHIFQGNAKIIDHREKKEETKPASPKEEVKDESKPVKLDNSTYVFPAKTEPPKSP
jgi:hypothetical protein